MANENETVEQVCEDIKIECSPNTSALIYLINRVPDIIAAHKRELAAKDAEIAKRDAIIKELADGLDKEASQYCGHCGCDDCDNNDGCDTYELLKKAREVVK